MSWLVFNWQPAHWRAPGTAYALLDFEDVWAVARNRETMRWDAYRNRQPLPFGSGFATLAQAKTMVENTLIKSVTQQIKDKPSARCSQNLRPTN